MKLACDVHQDRNWPTRVSVTKGFSRDPTRLDKSMKTWRPSLLSSRSRPRHSTPWTVVPRHCRQPLHRPCSSSMTLYSVHLIMPMPLNTFRSRSIQCPADLFPFRCLHHVQQRSERWWTVWMLMQYYRHSLLTRAQIKSDLAYVYGLCPSNLSSYTTYDVRISPTRCALSSDT